MTVDSSSGTTQPRGFRARRITRLKREIAMLEMMDEQLWRKAMICGAAIVLGLSAILIAIAYKLTWFGWHPLIVIASSGAIAFLCWLLSRYTLGPSLVLGLLGLALLFMILTEGESLGDLTMDKEDFKASPVEKRRVKCAAALERRKRMLGLLEDIR
jgi:hypothetical protein